MIKEDKELLNAATRLQYYVSKLLVDLQGTDIGLSSLAATTLNIGQANSDLQVRMNDLFKGV